MSEFDKNLQSEIESIKLEMMLHEIACKAAEPELHLWNVRYADKNGKKHSVRYCTATKYEAERLFNSERDAGDIILSIRKVNS